MQTIIGLLIIILPFIFKLIGRRLERAGQEAPSEPHAASEPIEDWAEVLRRHIEAQQPVKQPVELTQKPVEHKEKPKQAHAPQKPVVPILQEEPKKKRKKIDVKKMIVYSEIMKPKYTE